MNNLKKLLFHSLILTLLSSCQSVKENLSMQKKETVDEFLIEKKNPLVIPPEFSKLPVPKNKPENDISNIKDQQDIDLTKVLKKSEISEETRSSNELEKSISNILNKK